MAEELGSAQVEITANIAGLDQGLDEAKQKVSAFSDKVQSDVTKTAAVAQTASKLASAAVKDAVSGADAGTVAANSLSRGLTQLAARSGPIGLLAAACVGLGVALGKLFGAKAKKELEEYTAQMSAASKEMDNLAASIQKANSARKKDADPESWTMLTGLADAKIALEELIRLGADPDALRYAKAQVVKLGREVSEQIAKERREKLDENNELDRQANAQTAAERKALDEKEAAERAESLRVISEAQEAVLEQKRKELAIEQQIAETRIQGILESQSALERLYATQSAGFDGSGGNNSLEGAINALELTIRGMAARSGGL